MKLQPNSYEDAAESIQRLIDKAKSVRLFAIAPQKDIAAHAWERHLEALRGSGPVVPATGSVRWLAGQPSSVLPLDEGGEIQNGGSYAGWLAAQGALARIIRDELEKSGRMRLIGPPLWPHPRMLGVRGAPLVATFDREKRCRESFASTRDAQAAWQMVCVFEGILSHAISWECAYEGTTSNPLEAALDVYCAGAIPLGWLESGESILYSPPVLDAFSVSPH